MNKTQTFEEFLATQNTQFYLGSFALNLLITAVLMMLLSKIYIKYGRSLSNRKAFAENFLVLGITTMIVITIVKSSLALSLGLVGALSIVRFRTAIKEPEELSYMFMTIAIGLGLGANQTLITIVGFTLFYIFIFLRNLRRGDGAQATHHLYLNIQCPMQGKDLLENINTILNKYSNGLELQRLDETKNLLDASFIVDFSDFQALNQAKKDLQNLNENIEIGFLDTQKVFT